MEGSPAGPERENNANAALRLLGGAAAAPIAGLTKTVSSLTGDIRKIADSVQDIPALLTELAKIRAAVESLDEEVRLMRQGVNEIGAEVEGLPQTIADLDHTLHPLGRIAGKFRRGDAPPVVDEAPPAPETQNP